MMGDVYSAVLDDVVSMAQTATAMTIRKGAMPADESVSIAISNGGPDVTMLDRSTTEGINVVINGKSKDMPAVRAALGAIHRHLTRAAGYPNTEQYQIYAIETTSAPAYAGREPNNQWLFVSAVLVKIYFR